MPEISDDALTYTVKIRKGIYFQDDPCFVNNNGKGRELTAADFVFSIKRVADVKNSSSGYWAFNDRIVGLDTFREKSMDAKPTDYTINVPGLKALDRYTLQIKLTAPYPQLMWILTMHYSFAVPAEAVEYYGHQFVNHPVGTGPYQLVSWHRNYRLEYVRSPKWKETGRTEYYPSQGSPQDRKKGLLIHKDREIPFIDRIVEYMIGDTSTQWLMFLTGQLEFSGISRDNWNAVITSDRKLCESLAEQGISMYSTPELETYYIGFNMDDPIVGNNKKLRQALTCAFNTKEYLEFLNDRAIRAKGPIPPGIPGYREEPSPYPFNLDRAEKLLNEAGYPDGINSDTGRRLELTIDLGHPNDPEMRARLELVAGFFAEIGIEIIPEYNNWPTFLARLARRQVQMYMLGWVADYPDGENFLQLFYGPNSSPGPNHSNYVNKEFDVLYKKVRIMQPSPERTALYKQMADIVVEDCPWIFTVHPKSYTLTHKWITNYKPHDFPYGMIKYYYINAGQREQWKQNH
jgi:oligopeptide transport system substrate-binding protein